MRVACVGFAIAALAGGATRGGAQGLVPAGGLSIVSTRVHGTDQLTGTVLGGQGAVALGRVELALGYLQGKIGPEGAGARGQDLVEGVALLGVHPAPWLRIAAGPHVRSYMLTGGTQLRWVFWELRARASGAFVGSAGGGFVGVWRALSPRGDAPGAFAPAPGGGARMGVDPGRGPPRPPPGYPHRSPG